ncbi:MAG: ArgE/DapE family deacylase [Candidatus Helarchaeota archaeon]|nr:ArgE/DapE family deacylase [Candidatus Helarchaeota archaeon]
MSNIEKIILDKIDNMRDEIIKFHQQIIQIPSENPPGKYKEISQFVENKMNKIGLETKNKRNNVIGKWGSTEGKTLIFSAHLDTVEAFKGWTMDPFKGEIINNKIYGRGASDNKSSVTAEIFAAKALIESGVSLNGKLILTATIDEEMGGTRGVGYLIDKGIINGDACLLGDGPSNYPVGFCGGATFITFLIKGKQAHGMGFPDLPEPNRNEYSGINAIQKMVNILNFLMELQEEFNKKETKYPITSDHPSKVSHINLAIINGGTKISTVPDKCFLSCSIHTIPEQNVKDIENKILDFVEELKKQDPDLEISVQMPLSFEPQTLDLDSEFAKAVKKSAKIVFDEERDFKLFIPTTDAHWFQEKGIKTVLFGSIRADNKPHAADEFVYIEDLINTTKMFAITALNYLK